MADGRPPGGWLAYAGPEVGRGRDMQTETSRYGAGPAGIRWRPKVKAPPRTDEMPVAINKRQILRAVHCHLNSNARYLTAIKICVNIIYLIITSILRCDRPGMRGQLLNEISKLVNYQRF